MIEKSDEGKANDGANKEDGDTSPAHEGAPPDDDVVPSSEAKQPRSPQKDEQPLQQLNRPVSDEQKHEQPPVQQLNRPHDAPVPHAASQPRSSEAHRCSESKFPRKLYAILCNPEFSHAISWMPHGRSWRVLNKEYFMEEICPRYFCQTRFESFIRQVNGWGFKRLRREGPDRSSYYHENFLRSAPHLIDQMRRPSAGEKAKDTSEEPDFRSLAPMPELPPRYHVPPPLSMRGKLGPPIDVRSSFDAVPPRDYPPPYPSYLYPPHRGPLFSPSQWKGGPPPPPPPHYAYPTPRYPPYPYPPYDYYSYHPPPPSTPQTPHPKPDRNVETTNNARSPKHPPPYPIMRGHQQDSPSYMGYNYPPHMHRAVMTPKKVESASIDKRAVSTEGGGEESK